MDFAFWRTAPSVLFIAFAIFATGVLAFEWALRSRTSSLVHGFLTGRVTFFAMTWFSNNATVN
jgi:hypothetical protein